jgi:acetoacetyl-CoA synthetase
VVEELESVKDSVVVDTSDAGGTGKLWLFVVLRPGYTLDSALLAELTHSLRKKLSPRHVPDEIRAISEVPRTLSGKKLEVPIKRLLGGAPVDSVVAKGTLQNPDALLDLIQIANTPGPGRG